ncbi:hypothetical protein C9374_002907 [Naegleria lovaniensis]|uniref:Uncharacterized protein n=1 Tax=Naegleria lovaniensis TaxID=51637 RepID=A0AA88GT37_NAELO|nr:uncharacterized protein C9374_002907 [Naegleria lovaniensis]KAG2385758.1 hypothetical protein C9374_002907 [Naegleria lovaniensis]
MEGSGISCFHSPLYVRTNHVTFDQRMLLIGRENGWINRVVFSYKALEASAMNDDERVVNSIAGNDGADSNIFLLIENYRIHDRDRVNSIQYVPDLDMVISCSDDRVFFWKFCENSKQLSNTDASPITLFKYYASFKRKSRFFGISVFLPNIAVVFCEDGTYSTFSLNKETSTESECVTILTSDQSSFETKQPHHKSIPTFFAKKSNIGSKKLLHIAGHDTNQSLWTLWDDGSIVLLALQKNKFQPWLGRLRVRSFIEKFKGKHITGIDISPIRLLTIVMRDNIIIWDAMSDCIFFSVSLQNMLENSQYLTSNKTWVTTHPVRYEVWLANNGDISRILLESKELQYVKTIHGFSFSASNWLSCDASDAIPILVLGTSDGSLLLIDGRENAQRLVVKQIEPKSHSVLCENLFSLLCRREVYLDLTFSFDNERSVLI